MFTKMITTLLMMLAILAGGSFSTRAEDAQEKVDEVAVAKAKEMRAEAERLKASGKVDAKKVEALLTKAADMETNAHKLGNKCMQGSHTNIATIKKHHKNCEKCHVVEVKDGECARRAGDHEHYYCYCDCE